VAGLTQCNSFFDNPEAARELYDWLVRLAEPLSPIAFGRNCKPYARALSARNGRSRSESLVAGAVGEKSFRQISEEFAEIVIARVWNARTKGLARGVALSIPKEGAENSGASRPRKPRAQ